MVVEIYFRLTGSEWMADQCKLIESRSACGALIRKCIGLSGLGESSGAACLEVRMMTILP